MKRFLKIIFINLLIIFTVIFSAELGIWYFTNRYLQDNGTIERGKLIPFHSGIKPFNFDFSTFAKENGWGRLSEGIEYNKKPIVIFGCSYAYGYNLKDNQTFSHKLSKLTHRPVYNRAFTGFGIQHMLYQARRKELYSQVIEPEYVIYIYIYDHLRRLYVNSFSNLNMLLEEQYLRYKEKNGHLEEIKTNWFLSQLKRLYLYNKIQHSYVKRISLKYRENYYGFAIKHFLEAKSEMQKHWKNTKYIVLLYDNYDNTRELETELTKNEFTVIPLTKLTGKDLTSPIYLSSDKHPKEEAWDIIVPEVIKKLNL